MNSDDLCDYAERLYAVDGVAAALLGLQQRRGADVVLLLWCCWCAASGRGAIDDDALDAADKAVAAWREQVIRPLRAVRDSIAKQGPLAALPGGIDVRRRVLAVELESERVSLLVLERLAPASVRTDGGEARHAAINLGRYCRLLDLRPAAADQTALLTVLDAAFENTHDPLLRAALLDGLGIPDGG